MPRNMLALAFALVLSTGAGFAYFAVQRALRDDRPPPGRTAYAGRPVPQHHSECRSHADCPSRHACLRDPDTDRFRCHAAECESDMHCPASRACRYAGVDANGLFVRHCVMTGPRREGETCVSSPESARQACTDGLVCYLGFCGRRCDPDESSSCPAGFSCEPNEEGHSCLPSCDRALCPEGQRCFTVTEGYPLCGVPVKGGCMDTPCPAGQQCRFSFNAQPDALFVMRSCVPVP
jgi:hypothetical protein